MKTLELIRSYLVTNSTPMAVGFPPNGGQGSACYVDIPVQRGDIILVSAATRVGSLGPSNSDLSAPPYWWAGTPYYCGNGWNGAVLAKSQYTYGNGVDYAVIGHFSFVGFLNAHHAYHLLEWLWVRSAGTMRLFLQPWPVNAGTSAHHFRPSETLTNLGSRFAANTKTTRTLLTTPLLGENAYCTAMSPTGALPSYPLAEDALRPLAELVVSAGDYVAVLQSNPLTGGQSGIGLVGQPGHGPMLDAVTGGTASVTRTMLYVPIGRFSSGSVLEVFYVETGGTFTAKGLTPTVLTLMAQGDPAAMVPVLPSSGFVLI